MIATMTAYNKDGAVSHRDTRDYADFSRLREHSGRQQNNRKTIRVRVETKLAVAYEVNFSPWTPARRYSPSRRFHTVLKTWPDETTAAE
jgi:hypothetical protein